MSIVKCTIIVIIVAAYLTFQCAYAQPPTSENRKKLTLETVDCINAMAALYKISNPYISPSEETNDMLHELKLFPGSGHQPGLTNFKHAFKNLSIDKIQAIIDRTPGISGDEQLKKLVEKVTFSYFWYLLDGLLWRNEVDIFIDFPKDWCLKKVNELVNAKTIVSRRPKKLEAEKSFIVSLLFKQEDIQQEKKKIIKALYADWYYEKLDSLEKDNTDEEDPNYELPALMSFIYSSGYFTHVDEYIDHPMHSNFATRFGSIKTFCLEEGNDTIDAYLEALHLNNQNFTL